MRRVAEDSHPRSALSVDFRMWGPTPTRELQKPQLFGGALPCSAGEGTGDRADASLAVTCSCPPDGRACKETFAKSGGAEGLIAWIIDPTGTGRKTESTCTGGERGDPRRRSSMSETFQE